jgi:hypothetical protein
MDYKEALKRAKQANKRIDLHSFIVNKKPRIIAVKHHDGSYLEFHSAAFFKLDDKGEWMAVFTEHHGIFVYHFEDVKWIKELNENILYWYVDKD